MTIPEYDEYGEVPEQDRLMTTIINGCTVITHNRPSDRVFQLVCNHDEISKKQIANELGIHIDLVRDIVRVLGMNSLIMADFPRVGWVCPSYSELLFRRAR